EAAVRDEDSEAARDEREEPRQPQLPTVLHARDLAVGERVAEVGERLARQRTEREHGAERHPGRELDAAVVEMVPRAESADARSDRFAAAAQLGRHVGKTAVGREWVP